MSYSGRKNRLHVYAMIMASSIFLFFRGQDAVAQTPGGSRSLFDALGRCRNVAVSADRATCYDAAYDALQQARSRKEIVVVERSTAREARKGMFGFAGPKLPFFGDDDDDDDALKQVDSTIAGIQEIARDVYRLRLADGAVWQTTDELTAIPKKGGEIHIRRTTMGGYALSLGRGRAVKAIRIQ